MVQGRDVLNDLQSSIHYFENVAECEDDDRKVLIGDTLSRLRSVLKKVESEIKGKFFRTMQYIHNINTTGRYRGKYCEVQSSIGKCL